MRKKRFEPARPPALSASGDGLCVVPSPLGSKLDSQGPPRPCKSFSFSKSPMLSVGALSGSPRPFLAEIGSASSSSPMLNSAGCSRPSFRSISPSLSSTSVALAASRQRLSELAQHLQTSVEMERAAIAREIHDDVGGSLSALKFDLAWMARHATTPELKARLDSAMETVTHALEASQRIMHNLRPAILEQGLVAALGWMANRFERRTGVVCSFRTTHDNPQLPPGVPLGAYRTAQEALTNISKHAQATRVGIDLSLAQGILSLEVSDNGSGLKPDDLTKARSFGLRGLHQRARTVGGWVDVSSGPEGTTLLLSVPLKAARAHESELARDVNREHDPSGWGEL